MEEKTLEQIQKSISAAFDSVDLINKTILEPVNDKRKDLVDRNVKHCELMLAKEWFESALTNTQKTNLEAAITDGNIYISQ